MESNIVKQFIVILFLIIGATQIKAAGSYTDLFHIGKVGTTANTILEIGDSAEFRFNFSTLKMEVSNDGINYFEIIDRLLPDMTKGQILSGDAGTLYSVLAADTNGKFLSLNSSTATGLEWLDIPAGTPTLAKGGLITNNGASDVALPVGTNNFVLTADSAQANGVKWAAVAGGSDHTLTDTKTLSNKTWDFTGFINNIKTDGVAADLNINNFGAGGTYFYDNNNLVMYYTAKGFLRIGRENTASEGGQLMLESPSGTYPNHVYIDNAINEFRVHNGVNEWFTMNMASGAAYMHNTTGGGNVPHQCTNRSTTNSGANANIVRAYCAAGERVMGGGCRDYQNIKLNHNAPESNTNWYCNRGTSSTTLFIAFAICCLY